MSTQQQQTTKSNRKPTTIKGAWNLVIRVAHGNGIKGGLPSLKEYARGQASRSDLSDSVVIDAKRWLAVKRPGGSDEQRQERKARRKERQSINAAAKAAKKGKGKTNLKPSGEGKKKR